MACVVGVEENYAAYLKARAGIYQRTDGMKITGVRKEAIEGDSLAVEGYHRYCRVAGWRTSREDWGAKKERKRAEARETVKERERQRLLLRAWEIEQERGTAESGEAQVDEEESRGRRL
jgi:hypothetical protein